MKRAFTLTELLVVIAIIALIAAILFPVIANAKERSARATDVAHLKQLHAATLLYMGDNDGHLPNVNPRLYVEPIDGKGDSPADYRLVYPDPLVAYGMVRDLYKSPSPQRQRFFPGEEPGWLSPEHSDYITRFELIYTEGPQGQEKHTHYRVEPQPSTVLGYEWGDPERRGYLLMRFDGSVKAVPEDAEKHLYFYEGGWYTWQTLPQPGRKLQRNQQSVFEGEVWPPELTKMQ